MVKTIDCCFIVQCFYYEIHSKRVVYWCYGNESSNDGTMLRIGDINDTDSTPIDERIEKFNNMTVFKFDGFQYLNYRVVDNIALTN